MNKLTKWIVGDEAPPSSLNQSAMDDMALTAAAAAAAGSTSSWWGRQPKETCGPQRGLV
jgi:hypothetical protein